MPIYNMSFWAFLVGLLCCGFAGDQSGIRYVYDGDSIRLQNNREVRYIGIDAPEIAPDTHRCEYLAHTARAFNNKLLKDQGIRLTQDVVKKDRYGRILAYVFLQDGRMVNALMVEKGLAYLMTHPPNTKYRSILLNCQRKAMQADIALWQRLPKTTKRRYIGNRRSYRFHTPDCRFGNKISPGNRVVFRSLYEAFWQGYSPCKACNPANILKEQLDQ